MIEMDGSFGEGGGQIIRSSLSLSAVTGQPVTLTNIRAGREKPGLMRQHLTAVRAIAAICDAEVDGAELKSSRLVFKPGTIRAGEHRFQIGTAGSTSLVAQTLLPALMMADAPSSIRLTGGTHNPWCPPFEFLENVFLKQLRKMGVDVSATLHSHGFYPAGGGEVQIDVQPCSSLRGLALIEPCDRWGPTVNAVVSDLPASVGERECSVIRRKTGWADDCFHVQVVEKPHGPGNVVMIQIDSKTVSELFIAHGRIGVKAERVARSVLKDTRAFLSQAVPVGEYLADQLMMPMGLAAARGQSSEFRTGPLSMHSQTHLHVLKTFLEIDTEIDQDQEAGTVVVKFAPS